MSLKWNLVNVMYQRDVFSVTDLKKLINEKGNISISVPAVHRMVNKLPSEIKFSTLDALCSALDCNVNDLLVYEPPTLANKVVQPLVIDSGFKPPKNKKCKPEKKSQIKELPPI